MKRSYMAVGLSVAALASGCGSNACPTPSSPAKPSVTQKPEQVHAFVDVEKQARIDDIAKKAAAHFTNQIVNVAPKFHFSELDMNRKIYRSADKTVNYDGSRFTKLMLLSDIGDYGNTKYVSNARVDVKYKDGHPGTVRSLKFSDDNSAYKTDPTTQKVLKAKDGSPIPVNAETSEDSFSVELVDGHWKLEEDNLEGFGGTDGNTVHIAHSPEQAQTIVDDLATDLADIIG